MANYQNGLLIKGSDAYYGGYVFTRWLFEWLTQVVGWTSHDHNSSKWTDVEASGSGGTQGLTTADSARVNMASSGRSWTVADTGKYLTVTALTTVVRNGVYRIADVEPSNILVLAIKQGVHENGFPNSESFDWRLWNGNASNYIPDGDWAVVRGAYSHTPTEPNFDIKIMANTTYHGLPTVGIGPFGTWNNGTHAWSDARNTSQRMPGAESAPPAYHVWAYATDDHAVIAYWSVNPSGNKWPHFMYLGEITVCDTVVDTNPGVVLAGGINIADSTYWQKALGADHYGTIADGLLWMIDVPTVEVAGSLQVPSILPRNDYHIYDLPYRRVSSWSRRIYRIEIAVESVVTGHMENRGILKDVWSGGRYVQRVTPFGTNKEYLNTFGGLSIPWNGSKVHVQK
jgi:hypothetical protein